MKDIQDKITKTFCKAKYEARADLGDCVWLKICEEDDLPYPRKNKFISGIKLWTLACTALLSLVGLVPAVKRLSGVYFFLINKIRRQTNYHQ